MEHVLLLHGAIGASDQLLPLERLLEKDYIVHRLNFGGHGGKAMPAAPFSIALFAQYTLAFIDETIPAGAILNVFGYSMGGYVGMYIDRHHPGRIHKLITLATKYHWDEVTAAKEIKMLQPDILEQKVPAFAETLAKRHGHQWKTVLGKTADMLLAMGHNNPLQPEDYTFIHVPCLLMVGDRDKMVSIDETTTVYRQVTNGQLMVLPATGHPVEQLNLHALSFFITQFLGRPKQVKEHVASVY